MEIIHTRLLDKVAYGTMYARRYATQEAAVRSGLVQRNASRSNSVRRYVVKFNSLKPEDHDEVIAAFEVCDGPATGFLIKDWADYSVNQGSLGNAPAGTTAVQLKKVYTWGGQTKDRKITKPVAGAVVEQYVAGVWTAKAGTLDTTTGLFTPTTAWTTGAPLRWTGEFDVPVRFVNDELPFEYNNYNALSGNVELEEDIAQVIDP